MGWPGRRVGLLVGLMGLVAAPLTTLVLTATPVAAGPGCSPGNIEVTNNHDSGADSLRAAFATASGVAGPQTICVDSGVGTITLTSGVLTYDAATAPGLTLEGNGVTISGNNSSQVMRTDFPGPLTLNGVTVSDGDSAGVQAGGVFSAGNATVTNSTISNNTGATPGTVGGIFVVGSVTFTNSTVSNNTGGGVSAENTVTLINSTISGNTDGAGVFALSGLTFTNSTISGNTGGGGAVTDGNVTLVYSTVVENSTVNPGGANVYAPAPRTSLTSFGSVVAQARGLGANCMVTTTASNGFNLEDDPGASCGFSTATADLAPGTSSNLASSLANNGGPTQTLVPQAGSALIDAIPNVSCQADGASGITTDQRGLPRPDAASPACDIGAVEVQATASVVTVAFTG